MLTLNDLCNRLIRVDEVSLLEILQINSEDIVERFRDKIEDKYEELEEEMADEDSED